MSTYRTDICEFNLIYQCAQQRSPRNKLTNVELLMIIFQSPTVIQMNHSCNSKYPSIPKSITTRNNCVLEQHIYTSQAHRLDFFCKVDFKLNFQKQFNKVSVYFHSFCREAYEKELEKLGIDPGKLFMNIH